MIHTPLFPLKTVLFPGGVLPLRIFEVRYLDMVSNCLKNASGFAVVAIREGNEVGGIAQCYEVGTLARIVDFDRLEDGLLGITCQGEQRLRILSQWAQTDKLLVGQVELLRDDPSIMPPVETKPLLALLKNLLDSEEAMLYRRFLVMDWGDAAWVGNRLAEILPLPLPIKQALLMINDPIQRLNVLQAVLKKHRIL